MPIRTVGELRAYMQSLQGWIDEVNELFEGVADDTPIQESDSLRIPIANAPTTGACIPLGE